MPDGILKGSMFYAAWIFIVIGILTLTTGNFVTGIAVLVVAGAVLYWSSDGQPLGGSGSDIV